ncbi:MAG: PH domain-containing protein [Ruminococcus sp.]|nr:PH domain-containing protein [Ruminococcus sp.]
MKHEHPIKILRYCALNLWMLLFPLLRSLSLFPFSPEAFVLWLKGAWMDIMVMLFIFSHAFLKWFRCRFCVDEKCFTAVSGILFQSRISIPFEKITAVAVSAIETTFLLKLLLFRIDTRAAGSVNIPTLWLRKKDFEELSDKMPLCKENSSSAFTYRINLWRVLVYSFLFSSSLSGTLYIAAFFIEAGNAAGKILSELHITEALSEMSSAAASVFRAVPEIIILILIVLLFCRILSFVINLLRCAGFRTLIDPSVIRISSGFFPRRKTSIYLSSSECTIIKQGLLSRAFKRASMFITYSSSTKGRNKNTLLVPVLSEDAPINALFSGFEKNRSIANPYSLWSFIWQPLTIIGVILGFLFIISYEKYYACEILFPLSGIVLVPAAALLLTRLITFRSQFTAWDNKKISICCSKGISFFTVVTKKESIALVKTVQTPMARKKGFCNAAIYIKGGLKVMIRGQAK